jgi:outer membrane protein TolC
VAVVAAERVAEINRVGLRAALERGALARRRQTLGGGTAIDVVRADKDLESARALVVTGDESLRQARESLGLALGWAEQVGVAPTLRLDEAVSDASRECRPIGTLRERPDIVAAEQRVVLAEQVGKEARAGFYPTLGVQSQLAYTTQEVTLTYPTQWNVQAILSWNVWDGGTRYAQIQSSVAQREFANASAEGARRDLKIAIDRADRAVDVASASRAIAQRARDAGAEQERLIRIGFTVGNATSLELVTAASELRSAEIQLALREYELVRARLLALLVRARCDY